MIATINHIQSDKPGSRTGATAIFPRGLRPPLLEFYPAALVGDGAESTSVQVIEEFESISSPVILAPLSELGLIYDAALTWAFGRDKELSLGSGWPPTVIGIDDRPRHDVVRHRLTAMEVERLFREPASAPRWGDAGAAYGATAFGGPGGIGSVSRRIGKAALEAYVFLAGGFAKELSIEVPADRPTLADNPEGSNIAVLLTDMNLNSYGLRRVAGAGLEGLARIGRTRRTLVLAISVAAPIPARSPDRARRDIRVNQISIDAEKIAADAVAFVARNILLPQRVKS